MGDNVNENATLNLAESKQLFKDLGIEYWLLLIIHSYLIQYFTFYLLNIHIYISNQCQYIKISLTKHIYFILNQIDHL